MDLLKQKLEKCLLRATSKALGEAVRTFGPEDDTIEYLEFGPKCLSEEEKQYWLDAWDKLGEVVRHCYISEEDTIKELGSNREELFELMNYFESQNKIEIIGFPYYKQYKQAGKSFGPAALGFEPKKEGFYIFDWYKDKKIEDVKINQQKNKVYDLEFGDIKIDSRTLDYEIAGKTIPFPVNSKDKKLDQYPMAIVFSLINHKKDTRKMNKTSLKPTDLIGKAQVKLIELGVMQTKRKLKEGTIVGYISRARNFLENSSSSYNISKNSKSRKTFDIQKRAD